MALRTCLASINGLLALLREGELVVERRFVSLVESRGAPWCGATTASVRLALRAFSRM